jgi:hypothetical protein
LQVRILLGSPVKSGASRSKLDVEALPRHIRDISRR